MALNFNGNTPQNIIYNNPKSEVPEGYTKLGYIQSTGTQYINTNLALFDVSDHEIIIDFEPTEFYNYNTIWGSTYDADTFEGWVYSNGGLAMRYKSTRYGNDNNITVNSRHLIKAKKENSTLSKIVDSTSFGTGNVGDLITDSKFLLFLSGNDYGKYKLYSCKLYKGGTLVRNFIPCKRDSDNEIGLFDTINQVFYINAGTGEFLSGEYTGDKVEKIIYNGTTVWENGG